MQIPEISIPGDVESVTIESVQISTDSDAILPLYQEKDTNKKIVGFISSLKDSMSSNLSKLHGIMKKCEAAYLNEGYRPKLPVMPNVPVPLIQRHCNVASSKIEQAILNSGTLLQYVPYDPSSQDAAIRITHFIDKFVKNSGTNMRNIRHWINSSVKFGTGFIKVHSQFANIPTMLNEDDQHDIIDFGDKEVRYSYVSPNMILLDPDIITIEDQPYIIEVQELTKDDILFKALTEEYDKDAALKVIKSGGSSYESRNSSNDLNKLHPFYTETKTQNTIYNAYTCWLTDGYKFTIISDTLVEARKTMHTRENGGAPFVPFFYSLDSGNFFGVPLPYQIMPAQQELNDSKSLALYAKMSALYPAMFVNVNAINDVKNQIHKLTLGGVIEVDGDPRNVAATTSLPVGNYQAALADIANIRGEAEYYDGINENLMGMVTGGRTSTGTENIRNTNAHTQIDAIVNENIDNIIRLGNITLHTLKEIVTDEGWKSYVQSESGDFYRLTYDDFKGSFKVVAGIDANRTNPNAVQNIQSWLNQTVQAMQMGAKIAPSVVENSLRYLGELLGVPVEYLQGKQNPYIESLGEITKLETSGVANVNPNSDHLMHIVIELNYLNQPITPELRRLIQDHISKHVWELQNQAIKLGSLNIPYYNDIQSVKSDVASGNTDEFEKLLGVDFYPTNMPQENMNVPQPAIPQQQQPTDQSIPPEIMQMLEQQQPQM